MMVAWLKIDLIFQKGAHFELKSMRTKIEILKKRLAFAFSTLSDRIITQRQKRQEKEQRHDYDALQPQRHVPAAEPALETKYAATKKPLERLHTLG